jgi:ferric-dicitrate binding protein FerR (iron transport regulator)
MSLPRYAELARKLLVAQTEATQVPLPSADARAASIAAIERAIARRSRQRSMARWALGVAAAAAILVGFGIVSRALSGKGHLSVEVATSGRDPPIVAHSVGGGASVVVSGARAPLLEGAELDTGSRIVTPPNGRATLSFATGTSIDLGEGADLTIGGAAGSQTLRIATGFAELRVAKLSPGQRFLLTTPDAEIEVRGTQFRVAVTQPDPRCGEGTLTRVTVTEGVVSVRHGGVEDRVSAGTAWPAECPGPEPAGASSVPRSQPVGAEKPRSSPPSSTSGLAEQNNLFGEAAAAKRRGDLPGALSNLNRLLAKYPGSALAESAYAERMRLLRVTNPALAAAAARDYLARYPQGFAQTQAEAIAAEPQ